MNDFKLEKIKEKLGFDPFNPPSMEGDPFTVTDNKPRLTDCLTKDEVHYLNILISEKLKSGELKPVEW